MSAEIALIVARADNGVIGRGGEIPWRVASDLRRFRRITMGKPIIMGRRTFQSIGRALDGRDNVVVTQQARFKPEGVHVARDIDAAVEMAQTLATARGASEIMVIGGGEIYDALMHRADRIYLTEIHASMEGDTFFPSPDPRRWREAKREELARTEGDSAAATLVVYERVGRR